jgi:hypothetical protein
MRRIIEEARKLILKNSKIEKYAKAYIKKHGPNNPYANIYLHYTNKKKFKSLAKNLIDSQINIE